MNAREALARLRKAAKESFRRTYLRHGATGDVLGVSTADLKSLQKAIGSDDALARELWDSGIHEARILATLIAGDAANDRAILDRWAKESGDPIVADSVSSAAVRSPHAAKLVGKWIASRSEAVARTGWSLLAQLAVHDASLPDSFFEPHLGVIQQQIGTSKNRIRESMNTALIAIGSRNEALAENAIAVARRIGKVEVDHGDTACKTPDAEAYIRKTRAHRTRRRQPATP